jgi:hypothetical protein
VAALGNVNDAVRVIDIVDDRISGIDQLCQHRHGPLQHSIPRSYKSASISSSTLITSRWAADSIADPLAIV